VKGIVSIVSPKVPAGFNEMTPIKPSTASHVQSMSIVTIIIGILTLKAPQMLRGPSEEEEASMMTEIECSICPVEVEARYNLVLKNKI